MKPIKSSSRRPLMTPAWVCGGLSAAIQFTFLFLWLFGRQIFGAGHSLNPLMFLPLLVWLLASVVGTLMSIIVLIQECWDNVSRTSALMKPLLALVLNVVTSPFMFSNMY